MLMNRIKVIPHLLLEAPHPLMMLFSMSQEPPRWLSGTHHRLQLKQALQLKELKLMLLRMLGQDMPVTNFSSLVDW